jgi:hypothetical protein
MLSENLELVSAPTNVGLQYLQGLFSKKKAIHVFFEEKKR